MPLLTFASLPDTGRLWIFPAPRPWTAAEQAQIAAGLTQIIEQWQSHGAPASAGFEIRYGQFLLVGSDETQTPLSGCSMDYLRDEVVKLGRQLGFDLIDGPPICWRDAGAVGAIRCASRAEFKAAVQAGQITATTVVFDFTLQFVGELRAGRWERPFADSWHAKAFRLPAAATAK